MANRGFDDRVCGSAVAEARRDTSACGPRVTSEGGIRNAGIAIFSSLRDEPERGRQA
jgi:hypothetical protein